VPDPSTCDGQVETPFVTVHGIGRQRLLVVLHDSLMRGQLSASVAGMQLPVNVVDVVDT
jgi:hypothetical protein